MSRVGGRRRGQKISDASSVTSEHAKRTDKRAGVERTSAYVPRGGTPNVFFNKLAKTYEELGCNGAFDDFLWNIDLNTSLSDDELVGFLLHDTEFDQSLDKLLDTYTTEELLRDVMPPAPNAGVVYNRVENAEIIDIGSGDCAKLSRARARKVTATDVVKVANVHYEVVELDATKELNDFVMSFKNAKVVTSYNVLTQLDSIDQVMEHDGIHLYPDVQYMRDNLQVEVFDKGVKLGKYTDFDHPELQDADVVSEGYLIKNTYEENRINLALDQMGDLELGFELPIQDQPYLLKSNSVTPKYDGLALKLSVDDSLSYLVARNGKGATLRVLSKQLTPVECFLEKMPKIGKPQYYVLLRILRYKNIFPYHGTKNLENFVKKVKIKIQGVPVVAPGDPCLDGFSTDGFVQRVMENDYRIKDVPTFDIRNGLALASFLEDSYGIGLDLQGGVQGELWEYAYAGRDKATVLMKAVCKREDKEDETGYDKVARTLAWYR